MDVSEAESGLYDVPDELIGGPIVEAALADALADGLIDADVVEFESPVVTKLGV